MATRGHEVEVYAAAGSAGRGLSFVEIDVDPRATDAAVRADGIGGRGCPRSTSVRLRADVRGAARPPADVVSQHAFDAPASSWPRRLPRVHTLHLPPIDADVVRAVQRTSQPLVTVSESAARDWYAAGAIVCPGHPQWRASFSDFEPGPPERPPFALVCGRVSPEKGTHVAIRAARAAGLAVR